LPTRDTYANYLADLGVELREEADKAADEYAAAGAEDPKKDFKAGWLWAYIEVLSIIQDKAVLFDIPLSELRLDDLEPDTDLIRYGPGDEHQRDKKHESYLKSYLKRWFSKRRLRWPS
jgi:hypothetical protein